eukprot:Skav234290  [mRNA]  locus=scaffold2271:145126:151719:+ [translate_table: standard]
MAVQLAVLIFLGTSPVLQAVSLCLSDVAANNENAYAGIKPDGAVVTWGSGTNYGYGGHDSSAVADDLVGVEKVHVTRGPHVLRWKAV